MGAGGQRRREPTLTRACCPAPSRTRFVIVRERCALVREECAGAARREPSSRTGGRRTRTGAIESSSRTALSCTRVLRPRTLEARRSHGSAKRCSRRLARERQKSVDRIFSTAAARAGSLSHVACSDLSLLTVHGRRCGPSRDRSMLSAHATTCGRRSHLLCFDHEMSSCAPWARNVELRGPSYISSASRRRGGSRMSLRARYS